MRVTFFCLLTILITQGASLPFYHQNDYDIKDARIDVVWFNNSYGHDLKMRYSWYNRTIKTFNLSGNLTVDITSKDATPKTRLENMLKFLLQLEIQAYKFMSNEYRYFPLTLGLNLCEEYEHNNFNIQAMLNRTSNIRGCPLLKGFYYVRNGIIDFSQLPPLIPRGEYKLVAKIYYNKMHTIEVHAYGAVTDKPLKWN